MLSKYPHSLSSTINVSLLYEKFRDDSVGVNEDEGPMTASEAVHKAADSQPRKVSASLMRLKGAETPVLGG